MMSTAWSLIGFFFSSQSLCDSPSQVMTANESGGKSNNMLCPKAIRRQSGNKAETQTDFLSLLSVCCCARTSKNRGNAQHIKLNALAAASGGHRILAAAVHIANFLGIHKIMLCAFTSLKIQHSPLLPQFGRFFFPFLREASTKRNKQLLMT
jgi:hypothetical protein